MKRFVSLIGLGWVLLCGCASQSKPESPPQSPELSPAQVLAIFVQVYPNWRLNCDDPGFAAQRVTISLALDNRGRISRGPTLVDPSDDPGYQAVAESAMRALRRTAPFRVPAGFTGGEFTPLFNAQRACAARP